MRSRLAVRRSDRSVRRLRAYEQNIGYDYSLFSYSDHIKVRSHFTGGFGWFGQHSFSEEKCSLQPEKTVTISNLLSSEDNSLSAARDQWLVALSSFRQVTQVVE